MSCSNPNCLKSDKFMRHWPPNDLNILDRVRHEGEEDADGAGDLEVEEQDFLPVEVAVEAGEGKSLEVDEDDLEEKPEQEAIDN
uniref:Uncharacterized protein n=1 Tax=Panagrolaimus sp. ES5 TaxID=591445 RepID=A0AC34GE87_9BILA